MFAGVDFGFTLGIGLAALAVLVPFAFFRGRERRAMERLGLGPEGRMLEPQPKHPVVIRYFPNRQLRTGGLLTFCSACPGHLEFTVRRRGKLDWLMRPLLGLPTAITGDVLFDHSVAYCSADFPGSIKALQIDRVRQTIRNVLMLGCQELTVSKGLVTASWRGRSPGHTAAAFEAVARDLVALSFDLALIGENPEVAPVRAKAQKIQQRSVIFAVLSIFAASAVSGEFAPIQPLFPLLFAIGLALPLWIIRYRLRSSVSKGALLEKMPWEATMAVGWLGMTAAVFALMLTANAMLESGPRLRLNGTVITKWVAKKGKLRFGYANVHSDELGSTFEIAVTPESFPNADAGKMLGFTYSPGALGFAWAPGPAVERAALTEREPAARPVVKPLNID